MASSIGFFKRHWLITSAPVALAVMMLLMSANRSVGQDREAALAEPVDIGLVPCGNPDPPVTPCNIVVNKELFITDLCVVEDPVRTKWTAGGADPNALGAWTFGKLMASIAGHPDIGSDPVGLSNFVKRWLNHWLVDQIQGDPLCKADARPFVQQFLIDPWESVSGGPTLNMKLAPFRLLAIVNRIDLRKNTGYGSGNAGEARFVFGVLAIDENNPNPDEWSQTQFTVILEYVQPAETCDRVKDWANRWHALGSIPFGATFNKELQKITDDFAGFNAAPGRPNGSSISQVRTNDFVLDRPWELREFQLNGAFDPAPLEQTTVALTPDLRHNNTQLLADWLVANELDILHDQHDVPLSFNGQCFKAISAINPPVPWEVPGHNCTETRFKFAVNTCNGCHSDPETGTRFLHVEPRDIGQESILSRFLTGTPNGIDDPTCPTPPNNGAVTRFFNDLQRRALDLCDLLMSDCETDRFILAEMEAQQSGDASPTTGEQEALPITNRNLFEEAPHAAKNRVH